MDLEHKIEELLATFQDEWEKAPVFRPFPDGTYQVKIEDARIEIAKTSGRLQLTWVLKVLEPKEFCDLKIYHYSGLVTKSNRNWAKKELCICGLEVKNDLRSSLPDLIDRIIEVRLKTNAKGYQNVYINKRVSE